MKKIILTTAISTALIASSVYAAGPATSGLVLSGEGSYSVITDTYDANGVNTSSSTGFGLGGYVGYDYAITNHVTIGAKTGFYHSFGLGKGSLTGNTMKGTTNNIPLLLNSKYYFNSGLYLGGETGVNFQMIHYSNNLTILPYPENNANSNWNAQYVIGGLVGYQINENVSIDGSLDYMLGDPTYTALADVKFGLAVNYNLPM